MTPDFSDTIGGQGGKKLTLALMGEFSAGKTTLINFLLGDDVLPTRVTATQLPPVWISYGERAAFFVDDAGKETEIEIEDLATVGVEGVRYIRLFAETGILSEMDLIDTPGISDPNIPLHFRSFVAETADALLWCTHATQAWRESERSALDSMPKELLKHSILLATRSDKLGVPERRRVRERLIRETEDRFATIIMFSATESIEAVQMDSEGELWTISGADELLKTLQHMAAAIADPDSPRMEMGKFAPEEMRAPVTEQRAAPTTIEEMLAMGEAAPAPAIPKRTSSGGAVLPRRVRRDDTPKPAKRKRRTDAEAEPLALVNPVLPAEEVSEDAPKPDVTGVTPEAETPEAELADAAPKRSDQDTLSAVAQELSEVAVPADEGAEEEAAEDTAPEKVELTLVPSDAEADEAAAKAVADQLAAVAADLAADETAPEEDAADTAEEDGNSALEDAPAVDISDALIASIADRVVDEDAAEAEAEAEAEEAAEEDQGAREIPEEDAPVAAAVAAWNAYREEHSPKTMEDMDALIAAFLTTHSQEADDGESDTAKPVTSGWRLYV